MHLDGEEQPGAALATSLPAILRRPASGFEYNYYDKSDLQNPRALTCQHGKKVGDPLG